MKLCMKQSMRGAATVELALLLPLLLLLALGIADLGRALQVRLALEALSRSGAALAARGALPLPGESEDILATLAASAAPLDMRADGAIFISRITVADGATIVLERYQWHGVGNAVASRIAPCDAGCAAGGLPLFLPALAEGESAVVVEAHYQHAPLFSALFAGLAGDVCAITAM
jgi:hypothetical protein